mmetsp:Transcript_6118/g.7515  ORF Transcript_6118/g.7515 Transcript_6118/m.7515 type:complete len:109 (+) Transcript_6118:282-608(+)
MSELLIADIPRSDYGTETIDLMNRGGFGALLEAHEAATILESDKNNLYRRDISPPGSDSYALFFYWLERNESQVAAVFHGIHIQAPRHFPLWKMPHPHQRRQLKKNRK